MITVNTRVLNSHLTGVQRYAIEILDRLPDDIQQVRPRRAMPGILGHAWEQLMLPGMIGDGCLWSPSNTGPLSVRKQVVTIHDVVPLDHPEWLNPQFARWYCWLIPKLVQRVAHIIVVSEATKERLLHHTNADENRISVVPLGVDSRFHPEGGDDIEDTRIQLGIPSPNYILSLCSLEPRKNLKRLLEAWSRVHRSLPPDLWLVLAGARGRKQVFSDVGLSEIPPRVHFTGHVNDELVPPLYSGALAFAYVSVYEGFGLPPLEAMATGTPVLTGNQSSIPEVVGDAGLMVEPHDVDAIAEGLVKLATDHRLRVDLRNKGLERVTLFNWDTTAQQIIDILRKVDSSG